MFNIIGAFYEANEIQYYILEDIVGDSIVYTKKDLERNGLQIVNRDYVGLTKQELAKVIPIYKVPQLKYTIKYTTPEKMTFDELKQQLYSYNMMYISRLENELNSIYNTYILSQDSLEEYSKSLLSKLYLYKNKEEYFYSAAEGQILVKYFYKRRDGLKRIKLIHGIGLRYSDNEAYNEYVRISTKVKKLKEEEHILRNSLDVTVYDDFIECSNCHSKFNSSYFRKNFEVKTTNCIVCHNIDTLVPKDVQEELSSYKKELDNYNNRFSHMYITTVKKQAAETSKVVLCLLQMEVYEE